LGNRPDSSYIFIEEDTIGEVSGLQDLHIGLDLEMKAFRYKPPDTAQQYGASSGLSLDGLMLSLRFHPCFGEVCPHLAWGIMRRVQRGGFGSFIQVPLKRVIR